MSTASLLAKRTLAKTDKSSEIPEPGLKHTLKKAPRASMTSINSPNLFLEQTAGSYGMRVWLNI